jgi:hypothetical protein
MSELKLPSTRKLLAAALLLYFGRLLYKLARWVHHVLTSVDESRQIHHNCIPPADYKPTQVQQESLQLVKERYPELLPLVASGILVAVQPAKMLAGQMQPLRQAFREQQQADAAAAAAEDGQQDSTAQTGAAHSDIRLCKSIFDTAFRLKMQDDPGMGVILRRELPELLFIVGTVHVSKQSAEQVKQVLRVSQACRTSAQLPAGCKCKRQVTAWGLASCACTGPVLCPGAHHVACHAVVLSSGAGAAKANHGGAAPL